MNEEEEPLVLYSTPEAARLLHMPVRTLQHWVHQGRVKPTRRTLGGYSRWSGARILALYDQLRGDGGSQPPPPLEQPAHQ